MKELVFATHNDHKFAEIKEMMPPGIRLVSLKEIGCNEEIPETATTLEGNAQLKAAFVRNHYGYDCIADDTGLEVRALAGAPGVYSARYAGLVADAQANIRKLLSAMEGETDRRARFRTVIALQQGDLCQYFTGIATGRILLEPIGEDGFGYDPVFVPEGGDKSFAELSQAQKNKISHRGRAFRLLQAYLFESANGKSADGASGSGESGARTGYSNP